MLWYTANYNGPAFRIRHLNENLAIYELPFKADKGLTRVWQGIDKGAPPFYPCQHLISSLLHPHET